MQNVSLLKTTVNPQHWIVSGEDWHHKHMLLCSNKWDGEKVVEQPPPLGWLHWVRRLLFASARVRLIVSYSGQGVAV